MATYQMQPPAGVTTNKAGPGPGQVAKIVHRQFTLTAPMAVGDVFVAAPLQTGAIVHNVLKINGAAGNLGTTTQPNAFNNVPFTPYVVATPENVQFVATAAGGAIGDVVTITTHYLPRNN